MTRDAMIKLAQRVAGWHQGERSGRTSTAALINDLLAALRSRPAPPDDLALRHAWEAGFRLCRSYGDNHHHFDGEQKERRWRDYIKGLAAPAPVAAPTPPETPAPDAMPEIEFGDDVVWQTKPKPERVAEVICAGSRYEKRMTIHEWREHFRHKQVTAIERNGVVIWRRQEAQP